MSSDTETVISLQELQIGIKDAIQVNFSDYIWIHAELSEVNINRTGHCYIELIEKQNEQVVAKIRATIWSFTFRVLKPYFESSTGYEFTSGIKVSLKVKVEFHEIYGLSLNVKDIDPNYTIGDVEVQKRKILNQLEDDGIIDMNADLELPLVIQNIAVISSPTAAGFGDWENQIKQNSQQYKFNYQLFEAQMQGPETGQSIIKALDSIYQQESKFDVVVIIRGGGSKSDLAGFDQYELAANMAQFPIPIITGIGHERDESIADIVAHTALKTPTAVADFLIDQLFQFESNIDDLSSRIINTVNAILGERSYELEMATQNLRQISKYKIERNKELLLASTKQLLRETHNTKVFSEEKLKYLSEKLTYESKRILRRKNESIIEHQLNLRKNPQKTLQRQERLLFQLDKLNNAFNPKRVLDRGFAMIEQSNKIITSSKAIKKEKGIKIIMKDGEVKVLKERLK